MTAPLLGLLLPALLHSSADEVLPTLGALLADRLGAQQVLVHLPDYRLTALRELSSPQQPRGATSLHADQPVGASRTGQVFREQERSVSDRDGLRTVRAPIALRGQRLGVLTVIVAADGPAPVEQVMEAADALALVLQVVGQGGDAFETGRRAGRLSVAAEMQWQLLPGTGLAGADFALAGHLEPARRVGGDAFDWAHDDQRLSLTVADADGATDAASLACTLAVSALRNARRAQLPLHQQADLAGQALWAQFHGERHVSALLLEIDLAGCRAHAVAAGSALLLRQRGDVVQPVGLSDQRPLGADDDADPYHVQAVPLRPGDRLLAVTDGAIDAPDQDGLPYGVIGLTRSLRATSQRSPAEVVRLLARDLLAHSNHAPGSSRAGGSPAEDGELDDIGGLDDDGELDDDAALVCLDWHQR